MNIWKPRPAWPRVFAIALLPLAFAALHCDSPNPWAPPVPSSIHTFVAGQHLPQLQSIWLDVAFPELGLTFFRASFGPPQDCPAGCFYDVVRGIHLGGKIGWYDLHDAQRHGITGLTEFPLEAGDTALFREDVWARLEASPLYLLEGSFLPKLARDPNTPEEVLLRIGERLPRLRLSFLALALLENPVIESHPAVLQQIACLPVYPDDPFALPRARARELLGAAFQGCTGSE